MVTNHARKSPGHCSTGCATSWAICGPSWSHPDGAGSDPSRARRAASGHRAGDLGCARRRPACRRRRGGAPDDGRAAAGRGLDVVPTGSDTWEPCRPVRCTSSPPSTSSSTSTSRRCSRCSPRHRALRPGGLPVAETPNPTNLVMGACNLHPRPHPPRPDPARAAGVPGLLGRLRRDTGVPLHPKEDVDLPGLALPGLDEAASALVAGALQKAPRAAGLRRARGQGPSTACMTAAGLTSAMQAGPVVDSGQCASHQQTCSVMAVGRRCGQSGRPCRSTAGGGRP
jgi:hypothetical protein